MKRITLTIFALTFIFAAPAQGATCKSFQGESLQIVKIKATNTGCKTAQDVARGFEFKSSEGNSTKTIFDSQGRKWRCRITEEATGTDPGSNPYTRVRCTRSKAIVRFALRS